MGSYRDSLREVAKSLEALRDDLHEFAGVLESIAEKVNELEEENKNLKSKS
jgi:prefoldin subunit 5